jgi:hypothetical protein
MGDIVLEHVVLRLQRGELGHKTGIARGIEDDVSDAGMLWTQITQSLLRIRGHD